MPRGKGTVYAGYCTEEGCGARICTVRVLKSKKANFRQLLKYCKKCKKRVKVKLKEEKHSS